MFRRNPLGTDRYTQIAQGAVPHSVLLNRFNLLLSLLLPAVADISPDTGQGKGAEEVFIDGIDRTGRVAGTAENTVALQRIFFSLFRQQQPVLAIAAAPGFCKHIKLQHLLRVYYQVAQNRKVVQRLYEIPLAQLISAGELLFAIDTYRAAAAHTRTASRRKTQ